MRAFRTRSRATWRSARRSARRSRRPAYAGGRARVHERRRGQPSEAESHRLLAERFGKQGRGVDALEQWQQVVRIRSLDPTGWLALAKCQLAVGHGDEARKTLQHVLDTTWETHYGDVKAAGGGADSEVTKGVGPLVII
jgi:predicted ABC-class ATPase